MTCNLSKGKVCHQQPRQAAALPLSPPAQATPFKQRKAVTPALPLRHCAPPLCSSLCLWLSLSFILSLSLSLCFYFSLCLCLCLCSLPSLLLPLSILIRTSQSAPPSPHFLFPCATYRFTLEMNLKVRRTTRNSSRTRHTRRHSNNTGHNNGNTGICISCCKPVETVPRPELRLRLRLNLEQSLRLRLLYLRERATNINVQWAKLSWNDSCDMFA